MAQPATNPKIEELRSRLKSDPKNRIFYPLAEELRKVGQFAEAEQVLRSGLAIHPTYLSAWVSLGRVLRDLKNDRAAIEPLSKALQLDPGNVVAARLLGDSYLTLGDKVEAIKKYKLVQALMPGDEEVDSIVERLDAELNPSAAAAAPPPPMQAAPPPAAAAPEPTPFAPQPPPFAPEPSPFAPEEPPFTAEESPFAAEPPPFSTVTTEAPFDHRPEERAEETPFAPPAEVGEETATMRSLTPLPESPFAVTESPEAEEPFAGPSSEPIAAHADGSEAPQESVWAEPPPVFADAEKALRRELQTEQETGDAVPMSADHAQSPFEEPAGYSAASLEIESPPGMHVSRAPLAADVPLEVPAAELPPPDVSLPSEPATAAPVDESDVFAPSVEPVSEQPEQLSAASQEDFTNTITMADLYARQGLTADARQIYENILLRDPGNAAVQEKLTALNNPPASSKPQVQPAAATTPAAEQPSGDGATDVQEKAAKLERWLSKVRKREAGRV